MTTTYIAPSSKRRKLSPPSERSFDETSIEKSTEMAQSIGKQSVVVDLQHSNDEASKNLATSTDKNAVQERKQRFKALQARAVSIDLIFRLTMSDR